MKTAKGWESDTTTSRLHEQFGYAYDAAWNLSHRTNDALVQEFNVNVLNELTTATRSGTLTVAGLVSTAPTSVTVKDNNNSPAAATVYADNAFARAGITLLSGNNTFTAIAEDSLGRKDTNTVVVNLPATVTFSYDLNGNLTNDGQRVFEYDFQNQLTNVYVASAWRSEFQYDAFGRRRVRKEYKWSGSSWTLTNEVRYVYDGLLVVQERDANNLALVSYTRGRDLSGDLQRAGGIGGLLARTDMPSTLNPQPSTSPHAYYHADGNGNIAALANTNGVLVARYQYDPYGNLLGMAGPVAEANSYRFSSKEWHGNSGLYYYGFRYYDPNLQRWLNRDPIGEEGGMNLYRFVGGDAVRFTDPFGLCGESDPRAFLAALNALANLADGLIEDTANALNDMCYSFAQPWFPNSDLQPFFYPPPLPPEQQQRFDEDMRALGVICPAGRGGVRPVRTGQIGESVSSRVYGPKNTKKFQVNSRGRVPDHVLENDPLTGRPIRLAETKNVRYQYLSRQLRDDLTLVGPGGQLRLAIPAANATVSCTVRNNPQIKIDRILPPK